MYFQANLGIQTVVGHVASSTVIQFTANHTTRPDPPRFFKHTDTDMARSSSASFLFMNLSVAKAICTFNCLVSEGKAAFSSVPWPLLLTLPFQHQLQHLALPTLSSLARKWGQVSVTLKNTLCLFLPCHLNFLKILSILVALYH